MLLTYFILAVCPLTLVSVQEFPLPGSWSERGSERTGSGLRHRHSGRCGREGHSSAAKAICGHDPHPDFRWSLGSVRAHRRPYPVHKVVSHDVSATRSILCCCWRKKCKMWENLLGKKKRFCHEKVSVEEEKMNWNGTMIMVLSQCVQSCRFDSKLVNAQCSDSSVLCVRVYQSNCMMKIPFSLHLFEALVPAEAVWSERADQRATQLPLP